MNVPTSYFVIRRLLLKQKMPAKFNTIGATTINTIHNGIPLNMVHLRTLFSKLLSYVYQLHQFPSGPVHAMKTLQVFRIYKDSLILT